MSGQREQALSLKEFDAEMSSTRRVLERVPPDKLTWKPHEKSFSIGHLGMLVAWMPGWIAQTLREPFIDIGKAAGYSYKPPHELLAMFDENVKQARAALGEVTGDALEAPWSLRSGDHVLMTMPRGETVRQHLNHLIHHRGQLTVYLRLVDVPVPMVYGPTADERWS